MRFSKELRRLLIGGLLVLTAASLPACGASKEDPWSYDASFSQDILISSDPGETLFTGDEWTGKTFARDAGILIACDGLLEASALHYSVKDLQNASRIYSLPEIKSTYLNIDYGSRGTGGASCGPATLDEYRLYNDGRDYSYSYR